MQLFKPVTLHNRIAVLFMYKNLISSVYHLTSVSCNILPQPLLTSPDPRRPRGAAHTSMTKMKTIHRTQILSRPLCLTLCYSVAQESKVNFTVKMCRHSWECKSNHSDYLLQKRGSIRRDANNLRAGTNSF